MTTRNTGAGIVLDRIIGRMQEVSTMGPAAEYYFGLHDASGELFFGYRRTSDTVLALTTEDSGNTSLPSAVATPLAGVVVTIGPVSATLTLDSYVPSNFGNIFEPNNVYVLTFSGGTLPPLVTNLTALTILLPGAVMTVDAEVEQWAMLREATPDDFLRIGPAGVGVYDINDRVFVVRYDPTWGTGAEFTFEGENYIVRGIEPIGRRRYLAMLARVGI